MRTARAAHVHGTGVARGRSARPARTGPASACAAYYGAARRGVAHAGHGEGENSSPQLLVDGEGEKTSSVVVFSDEEGLRWPVAVL
jgi:hypothetical protein